MMVQGFTMMISGIAFSVIERKKLPWPCQRQNAERRSGIRAVRC